MEQRRESSWLPLREILLLLRRVGWNMVPHALNKRIAPYAVIRTHHAHAHTDIHTLLNSVNKTGIQMGHKFVHARATPLLPNFLIEKSPSTQVTQMEVRCLAINVATQAHQRGLLLALSPLQPFQSPQGVPSHLQLSCRSFSCWLGGRLSEEQGCYRLVPGRSALFVRGMRKNRR